MANDTIKEFEKNFPELFWQLRQGRWKDSKEMKEEGQPPMEPMYSPSIV